MFSLLVINLHYSLSGMIRISNDADRQVLDDCNPVKPFLAKDRGPLNWSLLLHGRRRRLLHKRDGVQAVCLVLIPLTTGGDDLVVGCLQVPIPVLVLGVLPYFEVHFTPLELPLSGDLPWFTYEATDDAWQCAA